MLLLLTSHDINHKFINTLQRTLFSKRHTVRVVEIRDIVREFTSKLYDIDVNILRKCEKDNIILCNGFNANTVNDIIKHIDNIARSYFGVNVILDNLISKIDKIKDNYDIVIIPDVRYKEEVDKLTNRYDCKIIKVNTPYLENNTERYNIDKIHPDYIVTINEEGDIIPTSDSLLSIIDNINNQTK